MQPRHCLPSGLSGGAALRQVPGSPAGAPSVVAFLFLFRTSPPAGAPLPGRERGREGGPGGRRSTKKHKNATTEGAPAKPPKPTRRAAPQTIPSLPVFSKKINQRQGSFETSFVLGLPRGAALLGHYWRAQKGLLTKIFCFFVLLLTSSGRPPASRRIKFNNFDPPTKIFGRVNFNAGGQNC